MNSVQPDQSRASVLWLAFAAICAAGAASVWYASNWGVGVSPDSAEYLAAARHLHGWGDLFGLPTQWAPGYPVLLKLFAVTSSDIFASTRLLQCLLMAGNLAAAMLVLRQVTGRDSVLPLGGGLVLLAGFPLWLVNFYAWSEGPFLLCQLLSALALLRFFARPEQRRLLFIAALLAAAALLFRYAGIAWVGAASLCVLLLSPPPWRQRWQRALLFGFTAVLPFALWLLANKLVRNETTNRSLVVHLVNGDDLIALLQQIGSWFGWGRGLLPLFAGLSLALATGWLTLKSKTKLPVKLQHLLWLCLAQVVVYTAFILVSKSFFDAYIPFDERIFVSAWLFTLLALAAAAMHLAAQGGKQLGVAVATALVFAGIGGLQLLPLLSLAHEHGVGYLNDYMRQISKVEELKALAGRTLYSNAPDYLRMQTDFAVHDYPRKFAPTTLLANPEYADELAAMQHSVQDGKALLVHYQVFEWRKYFPSREELLQLGYEDAMTGNGVVILIVPAPAPATAQRPAANQ